MLYKLTTIGLSLFLFYCSCSNSDSGVSTSSQDAEIINENFSKIPSMIPIGTIYPCTLTVTNHDLIDNYTVFKTSGEITTVITSATPSQDNIVFDLSFLQQGDYSITVILYKASFRDTLQKQIRVISTVPLSIFAQSSYHIHANNLLTIPYTLSDPDSNMVQYLIRCNGLPADTNNITAAQSIHLEGTLSIVAGADLQRINIYSIEVVDASKFTTVAICTVAVKDSVLPSIIPVRPLTNQTLSVTVLPCTTMFVVSDNWFVDSVKVSGFHQKFLDIDTIKIIKTFLDTGITVDSIEVWDRGLNRSVSRFSIHYSGLVQYPPKLKPITVTPIFEHQKFDTLYLDSFVFITDPESRYSKDSLVWTIKVDSVDTLLKQVFDPLRRSLYIHVPDVEVGVDRYTSFTIKVTDLKGLTDELQQVSFRVLVKNEAPVITIKDQSKKFGDAFDTLTLDKCATDSDLNDKVSWQIEAGRYFKPDSIWSVGTGSATKSSFSGRVAIIPDTLKFKPATVPNSTYEIVDSLKFTASDGDTTAFKFVTFTWTRGPVIIDIEY